MSSGQDYIALMRTNLLQPTGQAAPAAVPASQAGRQPFRVAAFGLGPRFLRLIEVIFQGERVNPHAFELANTRATGEFDIALVNLTVPGGVDTARRLRSLPGGLPVIGVGRRGNRLRGADDLLFSAFARDVLGVLNRAADALVARAQCRNILRTSVAGALDDAAMLELFPEPLRVLVIDPSPSSRRQVAVGMRQLGIEVDGVGNLEQAGDVLSMRSYDLVIVDPHQPDGCGLAMMRRFRRVTGSRVPVVVLSASSRLQNLLRSAVAGCDGYLVKPLSIPALHATARRILLGNVYRRQRAALGELPMAVPASGHALPRFPWRVLDVIRQMFAGIRLGRISDAEHARRVLEQARERARMNQARARGDGACVDSLLLSPSARPVWRPGSTHALVDMAPSRSGQSPQRRAQGSQVRAFMVSSSIVARRAQALSGITRPRHDSALV